MIKLLLVEPSFIDFAWKDGANCLGEACEGVDEITGDQLKMLLARNERTLVRLDEDGKALGWGCYRVDQLPNIRVLHITDLVAHNAGFERFFQEIKEIGIKLGCSQVRLSAKAVQARLYRMKCNFEPVYETMKVDI